MARKKKNSNLPEPKYADGGNRYIGKCKENSEIFCLLCQEFGCVCVQPSETEEVLKVKLAKRIHDAKVNMSLSQDRGRWSNLPERVAEWEARLAKL